MLKSFHQAILLGALMAPTAVFAQEGGLFGLSSSKSLADKEAATVGTGAAPRQVSTRLSTFGIPINAPPRREGIKEIQLHVSADLGKTWHLYYRVSPTDKFFPFKAATDGEYWFATRVVEAGSRAGAETELRPEMKVVIDSTPPKLQLTSQLSPTGEIVAKWQAIDPLLSTQSLKLEYQTSPTGPWRTIVIPAGNSQVKNGQLAGSVSWQPRDAGAVINLRAEILDQAGNHAVALDRLEAGAIARTTRPLEPPVAGPPSTPAQQESKGSGPLSAVSSWLGGALGGKGSSSSPPADPYASNLPSDTLSSSESSSDDFAGNSPKPQSSWGASNTELTEKGIRRIATNSKAEATNPPETAERQPSERRGPGRLASASTVREPKQELGDEPTAVEPRLDEQSDVRPSIQPPQNSPRSEGDRDLPAIAEEMNASSAEEIPAPLPEPVPEPRLVPAKNDLEPESPPSSLESVEAAPPRGAVESLPNDETTRQPIPSAPRKKPGEYRVRSPIASGKRGDEQGFARPPANPSYRNASAAREAIESTRDSGRLPPGIEPIYTNRQRFGLEYDVNTVGSSGVSEVELWATRDGGQSWSRWGSDPDRRSPFDVEVDGEGAFGFRIVVMSRGGLTSRPPQPGDEADQWVVVDSTAPQVELRGAGYGAEERVGQLEISWDAQDANLTEKSVSLFYSDSEDGPWTRIVSDLANQGEYFWRVDSRVPPKIFIKVEVQDGAGNVASDRTREPIGVEGLVPSGKIRRLVPRTDDDRE